MFMILAKSNTVKNTVAIISIHTCIYVANYQWFPMNAMTQ